MTEGRVAVSERRQRAKPGTTSPAARLLRRGKIAVLLSAASNDERWERSDRPALERALEDRHAEHEMVEALGDPSSQRRAVEDLGADVSTVILAAGEEAPVADITEALHARGMTVIDFGRPGTIRADDADYYVGFDEVAAGRLQISELARCLLPRGVAAPRVAVVRGSDTDETANLNREGRLGALTERFDEGVWTRTAERMIDTAPGADVAGLAKSATSEIIVRTAGQFDAVVAENDDAAAGVIVALRTEGMSGVPVSGDGATLGGIRRVLTGEQCLTVHRPATLLAGAAAEIATALARRHTPTGATETRKAGPLTIPAQLISPIAITADTVARTVIADGTTTWEEICIPDIAFACPPAEDR